MMYRNLLMAAASLSATMAAGTRGAEEEPTLGGLFLAAAGNVSDAGSEAQWQRDFNLDAQISTGEDMASLAVEIREVCDGLGYVQSENSYTDSSTGELQNLYLNCRFGNGEDYDVAVKRISDAVSAANPKSKSSSTNVYNNGYNDVSRQMAMQRGMEMLLQKAETIEEVMLIVPYWSNYVTSYPPPTSSININLNKGYADYEYLEDDLVFTSTDNPTMMIEETFEVMPEDTMEETWETKESTKKMDGL